MKKVLRVLILGFILISMGCTLLPWVKDGNNIYDWFTKPTEDAIYYYKSTYYNDNISLTSISNYQFKFISVDENNDNITVLVNDDGTMGYIVADRDENLIFYGSDQFFSGYSDEEIYLEAPVVIDNSWPYKSETRKIASIDTTVDIEAGKYSDVVKVKIIDDDLNYTGYYYWSISRGLIYSRIDYENGSYKIIELINCSE
ncbi:MAG: hypothetical protein COX48_00565 [bacterium (Candidatus Stahlbacteria) CG23_combo_of_CG06-09_8_20_14_all_34_7]|nr:MAG: hypothetical protein COX48_00565 [bacterium (Candidatus Stahlbacteria) CG23_combo_of_CG06-09_8_20_14_all_34_7]